MKTIRRTHSPGIPKGPRRYNTEKTNKNEKNEKSEMQKKCRDVMLKKKNVELKKSLHQKKSRNMESLRDTIDRYIYN